MFEILRQVQPKPRPTLINTPGSAEASPNAYLKEPLQTSTRIRFSLWQIETCQNSKRNLSGVSNGISKTYRRLRISSTVHDVQEHLRAQTCLGQGRNKKRRAQNTAHRTKPALSEAWEGLDNTAALVSTPLVPPRRNEAIYFEFWRFTPCFGDDCLEFWAKKSWGNAHGTPPAVQGALLHCVAVVNEDHVATRGV
jgi:hypothetical protein